MTRPVPFDLALDALEPGQLQSALAALEADAIDLQHRDAVLLHRAAATLLRALRPDEGLGDAADEFVAFLHHALAWAAAGRMVAVVSTEALALMLVGTPPADACIDPAPRYIQFPLRRVWGQPVPGEAHEPLDGLHVLSQPDGALRVLACFGVHAHRAGVTVAEVSGPRPELVPRADGTARFAPTLPGGADAGLHELIGADELLELGWRASLLSLER